MTIRLWDSGVRLSPSGQVLYLGQMVEETLVQRFGLFSYWRADPLQHTLLIPIREALAPLDQKLARPGRLLIRE